MASSSSAAAAAASEWTKLSCNKCKKSASMKCSVCLAVAYCSKACQTQDWAHHKKTCKSTSSATPASKSKKALTTATTSKAPTLSRASKIISVSHSHFTAPTTATTSTNNGTGYGGNAGRDEKQRKKGKAEAKKRETKAWEDWQTELKTFCQKKHPLAATTTAATARANSGDQGSGNIPKDDSNAEILDTLKQVLRCQAPDWWWQQPQRNLYVTALQACTILSEHYPTWWGDPEDDESAMAALEELAQTSQMLAKQLGKQDTNITSTTQNDNDNSTNNGGGLLASAASTVTSWFSSALSTQNSNDKDASLPLQVMAVRDQAAKIAALVLEKPECSMMGPQDYYRQALRPLAFDTVESFDKPPHYFGAGGGYASNPSYSHHYGSYLSGKKTAKKQAPTTTAAQGGTSNGMKASAAVLWKELSTYPTALPIEYGSSIFVRSLENEMDKLRVLIIGPEDTPYQNGCFLFDAHMTHDYPRVPPKVQFLTTSNFLSAKDKRVRFNPNLYNDGKVCLSLLGTWAGPGWQSGESTFLQVLVSIQSLILGVADPYFNEPGFDGTQSTQHGKKASADYNKNIRRYTLQVAILPFLQNQLDEYTDTTAKAKKSKRKDPPGATNATGNKPDYYFAEFKDVIEKHFRLKHQVIQKQLFQWLQDDSTLEKLYAEYWTLWDKLEEQWQLQSGSGGPNRGVAKRARRGKADAPAPKVDSPAVKMKDGVILLDDDDDDDLEDTFDAEMALAIHLSVSSSAAQQQHLCEEAPSSSSGDGVIELADSDDENDAKPAAKGGDDKSDKKKSKSQEEANATSNDACAAVASLKVGADGGDVVDLT